MLAAGVLLALAALPQVSIASSSLALSSTYYPHGTRIVALPSTNTQADTILGPVHHHHFAQLHRVDGSGWLQTALWHFSTGRGGAKVKHDTIFGYGINVFPNSRLARKALADVSIKTSPLKVDGLPACAFSYGDVHQTLVFVFLAYGSVEVEAYYEYKGVAPAKTSTMLRTVFTQQLTRLAKKVRSLVKRLRATPTPRPSATQTPTATATSTPTATETPAPTATATMRPTAIPVHTLPPTATSTATPQPSPTAAGLVLSVQPASSSYHVRSDAVIHITVTQGGNPVIDAAVDAAYNFPTAYQECSTYTDNNGQATCHASVPVMPDGSRVVVQVSVRTLTGDAVQTEITIAISNP